MLNCENGNRRYLEKVCLFLPKKKLEQILRISSLTAARKTWEQKSSIDKWKTSAEQILNISEDGWILRSVWVLVQFPLVRTIKIDSFPFNHVYVLYLIIQTVNRYVKQLSEANWSSVRSETTQDKFRVCEFQTEDEQRNLSTSNSRVGDLTNEA